MDMEIKRGPGRPKIIPGEGGNVDTMRGDLRPELRDDDPQAAARRRTQQIMAQIGDSVEEADEFFVPDEVKDPYWDYQWVRHFTYNQEDTNNINRYKRSGWEYVPPKTPGFERFVPANWKESFILKDGMALMTRPKEVSELINARQEQAAKHNMKIAENPMNARLAADFSMDNNGRPVTVRGVSGARRSISGPIPN